ncbi:lipid IV(A) 3-deoxy-D-manno-octulosonic acid transferase [Salinisphaera sp. G21_0]|uniref:lipid IV(A) 3-deoxy-D-manno-octulosonic acid transferase n=1 Tax=Salinisphaera sp. G21_0 TaxID=2821094 RepID=UPI001ADA169F|nr:lipid IV(A) 3-deoxy-D-manno-octulosonic acid transferase [Salinisphaera sp. G21_0]MBO9481123.1 lipid IV(A) 3-deoxy-D-manno-octulosonic acid transferase [Salinisphaera sp. G21_0]
MSRIFYSLLLYLISPLAMVRLYLRSKKAPEYWQRKRERFGFFSLPASDKPIIWVHSVSMGETIASGPLVKQLQKNYPTHRVLITTMTPTGSAQVGKIHGDSVDHVYASYDLPCAVRRFLDKVKPVMAIVIDTELWPNTIAACHKRSIPVLVTNARLSERSARGYGRFGFLTHPMLKQIDMVAAQNQETGRRFLELGLPEQQLNVTGSIKFDLDVAPDIITTGQALRQKWQQGMGSDIRILVAASTHDGEDQQVLDAFKIILAASPEVRLLLVPRHPERFDRVHQLILDNQLPVVRHSQGTQPSDQTRVILGDTMGEMMKLFSASDIAFVGGSLVPTGGHNMLEPAALNLPVLSGPHVFNFEEISESLIQAGGLNIVNDSEALARSAISLVQDKEEYKSMSLHAGEFVRNNRGALQKTLMLVDQLMPSGK